MADLNGSPITDEQEIELRDALRRIEQGKTPGPMKDPYSGKPMNRAQRRQMKVRVGKRLKKMERKK